MTTFNIEKYEKDPLDFIVKKKRSSGTCGAMESTVLSFETFLMIFARKWKYLLF